MTAAGTVSLWVVVAVLGAFHGANPSMGWLFAVSNGLFERRSRAVFAALPPIALGHLLAMAVVLLPIAVLTALSTRLTVVKVAAGVLIIAFGVYRLIVRRHPRALARIGPAHLTLWSFVIATAHGAALMLVPVYFKMGDAMAIGAMGVPPSSDGTHAALMADLARSGSGLALAAAVAVVHTTFMLAVAAAIAWTFYRYLGLAVLRQVWFNLDVGWAIALIIAGIIAIAT